MNHKPKPSLLLEGSTVLLEEFEDGTVFYHLQEHLPLWRVFCEVGSVYEDEIVEGEVEGETECDLKGIKKFLSMEPLTKLHGKSIRTLEVLEKGTCPLCLAISEAVEELRKLRFAALPEVEKKRIEAQRRAFAQPGTYRGVVDDFDQLNDPGEFDDFMGES